MDKEYIVCIFSKDEDVKFLKTERDYDFTYGVNEAKVFTLEEANKQAADLRLCGLSAWVEYGWLDDLICPIEG